MDNVILRADKLWDEFESLAHFGDTSYDAHLAAEIRAKLNLPSTGPMKELLKDCKISVESLLSVILSTMQPFSQMMSDLLHMFESISAKKSDTNLRIRFDFDANSEQFLFDLESFRESAEQAAKKLAPIYDLKDPWKMVRLFNGMPWNVPLDNWKYHNDPAELDCWLYQYNENDQWPDTIPRQPLTGLISLDNKIRILWAFTEQAIRQYKQAYDPNLGRKRSHEYECQRRQSTFWYAEEDRWTASFFTKAITTVNELNALPSEERISIATTLEQRIDDFLKSQTTWRDEATALEDVMDVLSLPFWKRRHELYSAWIFTRITSALEDMGVEFHVVDGVLSFSFAGVHLATCTKLSPPLHIYTELRTLSSKLQRSPRSNRNKHIQPDYSLAIQPIRDPSKSVTVVECKQYKKPSKNNFLNAITDYAEGRPNATVFLVDYGRVPAHYHSLLKKEIQKHAFLIGDVRPNESVMQNFQTSLRQSILDYYKKRSKRRASFILPWDNPNALCTIQLKWNGTPRDLDLHLRIRENNITYSTVDYKNPAHFEGAQFAQLDQDCTNGHGCETIRIEKWRDAQYDVIVDNYSGESIVEGKIEVSIQCGSIVKKCFYSGVWRKGCSWHAFRLSTVGVLKMNCWISRESISHL